MCKLTVTDLRVLPGDAAFLIDDGTTAILYDTGFGFTGSRIADRIQAQLGKRALNYIFLTHSHYDHALGCAAISQRYPMATVVASTYAKHIFEKSSAKAVMLEMDRKAAHQYGISEYPPIVHDIRVDLAVEDGDAVSCGDLNFTVVALPGHTKCSIGFYCREHKLLLGTETLGVCFGQDTYLPSFLVGYEMTLGSFQKVKALEIDQMVLPHYGLVDKETAGTYLSRGEEVTISTAEAIKKHFEAGYNEREILSVFAQEHFPAHVAQVYPLDAFLLNTGIMIRLVQKELIR